MPWQGHPREIKKRERLKKERDLKKREKERRESARVVYRELSVNADTYNKIYYKDPFTGDFGNLWPCFGGYSSKTKQDRDSW